MPGFGNDTDYWELADTNIHLVRSSKTPEKQVAKCPDSYGDNVGSTLYDTVTNYECEYVNCGDTIDFSTDTGTGMGASVKLGKIVAGKVITGANGTTENTARPRFTVAGRSTNETGGLNEYTIPLSIPGSRKAHLLGATAVDSGSKLTGSNWDATCDVGVEADSNGNEGCLNVSGCVVTVTNEGRALTAEFGVTADTANGWQITTGPSDERENTDYGSGSVTLFQDVTRDT